MAKAYAINWSRMCENTVRLTGVVGVVRKAAQNLTVVRIAEKRFRNGKEETTWHALRFNGKLAPLALEYLEKGDALRVDARLAYETIEVSKTKSVEKAVLWVDEFARLNR